MENMEKFLLTGNRVLSPCVANYQYFFDKSTRTKEIQHSTRKCSALPSQNSRLARKIKFARIYRYRSFWPFWFDYRYVASNVRVLVRWCHARTSPSRFNRARMDVALIKKEKKETTAGMSSSHPRSVFSLIIPFQRAAPWYGASGRA